LGAPVEIRLHRRRVYILPTRAGVLFILALITMLLGCINYNNSLGYLLTFWLASLGLVSIFHTYRNLAGLRVVAGRVRPVNCGDLAIFEMNLVNEADYPRHGVLVRFRNGEFDDSNVAAESVLTTAIPAKDRAQLTLPVRTARRGWIPLGKTTIASRYPLGLFRAWSVLDTEQIGLVYPQPDGEPHLPAGTASTTSEGVSSGPGNDDFAGLRPYQYGDSMRQIHWKAAARSEHLPVKEFSGMASDDLLLELDTLPGPLESRISQLALWVHEAEAARMRYALRLGGVEVAPGSGETHHHRCLTHLALHGLQPA
jgi:uncharacterized protein (DUF58 family)